MDAASEAELIDAYQALARAELERDVAEMRRLIHPEFEGVGPDGGTLTREDVVETYGSGMFVLQSLVVEEQHVRVLGDTGVVTAHSTMRGRTPAGEFHSRLHFTDVWVRAGGGWRLFASHVTPERGPAGFHSLPGGAGEPEPF